MKRLRYSATETASSAKLQTRQAERETLMKMFAAADGAPAYATGHTGCPNSASRALTMRTCCSG